MKEKRGKRTSKEVPKMLSLTKDMEFRGEDRGPQLQTPEVKIPATSSRCDDQIRPLLLISSPPNTCDVNSSPAKIRPFTLCPTVELMSSQAIHSGSLCRPTNTRSCIIRSAPLLSPQQTSKQNTDHSLPRPSRYYFWCEKLAVKIGRLH